MSEQTPKPGSQGLDPSMDPVALHQLAQARPDLWPQIIAHPNAYPGLLAWFKTQDRPDVQEALAKREGKSTEGDARPAPGTPLKPQARSSPRVEPPLRPAAQPTVRPAAEPAAQQPASGGGPALLSPFQRPARQETPKEHAPLGGSGPSAPSTNAAQQVRVQSSARSVPYASRVQRSDLSLGLQPSGAGAEELEDRTVLAARRKKVLGTLSFGADPVELVKKRVVIGRTLKGVEDEQDLQKVLVTDPSKTVSGTHAELTFKDDTWYVEDLDSTNGVYRVDEDGEETEVVGVQPITGDFYLGDVLFTLEGAK